MASPHPRAGPFRAALGIETLGDLALRLGTARLAVAAPGELAARLREAFRPYRRP